MLQNDTFYSLFLGGRTGATNREAAAGMQPMNTLPVPWLEAVDISNAVLYLASDESRYVTGTTHVVGAGAIAPFSIPTT